MDTQNHRPSDDNAGEVPQAVTDEELFAAYLKARTQQALDNLNAARDELAAQPTEFNRALLVMRRVQELRELRKELDAQLARVDAARAAAGLAAADDALESANTSIASPAFRAAQAEQAARIIAALAAKPRTCPSCQALLAADAARCHCGYAVRDKSSTGALDPAPSRQPSER